MDAYPVVSEGGFEDIDLQNALRGLYRHQVVLNSFSATSSRSMLADLCKNSINLFTKRWDEAKPILDPPLWSDLPRSELGG